MSEQHTKETYFLVFNYAGKDDQPIILEWTFGFEKEPPQVNIEGLISNLKGNNAPQNYIQRLEDVDISNHPEWIRDAQRWLFNNCKSHIKTIEDFQIIEYRRQLKDTFRKNNVFISDDEVVKTLNWLIERSRKDVGQKVFKGYTKSTSIKRLFRNFDRAVEGLANQFFNDTNKP
ncbi:hypothetical protein [Vibrio mytili]|nr:hypothetical protein [Vibrio mytili]